MGLYIPNVRLPDDGDFELWIAVRKDGSFTYNVRGGWRDGKQKAVPVPPHGRTIDKDVMCNECRRIAEEYDGIYPDCTYCPAHLAPTIIPAEEGET
jgi:hypothetical protein